MKTKKQEQKWFKLCKSSEQISDKMERYAIELIKQVEMSDFRDELGHQLKMNRSYKDLVEFIKSLTKESE